MMLNAHLCSMVHSKDLYKVISKLEKDIDCSETVAVGLKGPESKEFFTEVAKMSCRVKGIVSQKHSMEFNQAQFS